MGYISSTKHTYSVVSKLKAYICNKVLYNTVDCHYIKEVNNSITLCMSKLL